MHVSQHLFKTLTMVLGLSTMVAPVFAQQTALHIRLPSEFILDVTDFGADPSGKRDSTAAFQQALNSIRASDPLGKVAAGKHHGKTLYIPNGTYIVSDAITADHENRGAWGGRETPARHIRIYGEHRHRTIIQLKDRSAGFADPNKPKPVFSFFRGHASNTSFMNAIRNLTIDLGTGNKGAIGIDFHTNNGGGIDHVTVDARDGGFAGIRCHLRLGGIGMLYQTEVIGGKYGAYFAHGHVGYALQTVRFTDQAVANIYTADKPLWIFDSLFASRKDFMHIEHYEGSTETGLQVVIDGCTISGKGRHAIRTQTGTNLYVRRTQLDGFRSISSGDNTPAAAAAGEYLNGQRLHLFPPG